MTSERKVLLHSLFLSIYLSVSLNSFAQRIPEIVAKNASFIDFSGGKNNTYRCVIIGDKGYIPLNNYSALLETGGSEKNSRLLKSYNGTNGGFVNMVATSKYLYLLYRSNGYFYVKRIDPVKDQADDIKDQNGNKFRFIDKFPNSNVEAFPNIFAFQDRVCIMNYVFNSNNSLITGDTYFSHDADELPKLYNASGAASAEINFMYASAGVKFNMIADRAVHYKNNDSKLYLFEYKSSDALGVPGKNYLPITNYDIDKQQMSVAKIATVADKFYVITNYNSGVNKGDSSLLFELSNRMNFKLRIPKGTNYISGNNDYLYLQSDKGIYQLDLKTDKLKSLVILNKDAVFLDIQTWNQKLLIENGILYFAVQKSAGYSREYKAFDLKTSMVYSLGYSDHENTYEKVWLHVIGDYYYYLKDRYLPGFTKYYNLVRLNYKTGTEEIITMPVAKKETCEGITDIVQTGNVIVLNVKYKTKNGLIEDRVVAYKP